MNLEMGISRLSSKQKDSQLELGDDYRYVIVKRKGVWYLALELYLLLIVVWRIPLREPRLAPVTPR